MEHQLLKCLKCKNLGKSWWSHDIKLILLFQGHVAQKLFAKIKYLVVYNFNKQKKTYISTMNWRHWLISNRHSETT